MKIRFRDYVITHSYGINKYDLLKVNIVQKKGKNFGDEQEVPEAYGVTLERVFRIILDDTIELELGDIETDFKGYFETYKECNNKLLKEIQGLEASLNK